MKTRVRKKTPSSRQLVRVTGELEIARQELNRVQTLLSELSVRQVGLDVDLESAQSAASEEHETSESRLRIIETLRNDRERLERINASLTRRLQADVENGQNSGDAAAVLAYLLMPSGSLNAIMGNFQQTAVKLGIGPEVKRAATEAITRAAAAFTAGEWPDDKLRERAMAEGGMDPMDLLGAIARLDPEGFGPLEEIFGAGPRRASRPLTDEINRTPRVRPEDFDRVMGRETGPFTMRP